MQEHQSPTKSCFASLHHSNHKPGLENDGGGSEDEHEDTSGMDGDCDDNYHALIKSSLAYLASVGTAHKIQQKDFQGVNQNEFWEFGNRKGKEKKRSQNSGTGREC